MYRLWLVRCSQYTKDNYESFDEFYEKSYPKKFEYDPRTTVEIIEELRRERKEQ